MGSLCARDHGIADSSDLRLRLAVYQPSVDPNLVSRPSSKMMASRYQCNLLKLLIYVKPLRFK